MQVEENVRHTLLAELASLLSNRIKSSMAFDAEVRAIIDDLKVVGHDLYLFDSDREFEVWCGNWIDSANSTNLILYFYPNKPVEVLWGKPPQ